MRLNKYFLGLAVAGIFFAYPVKGHTDEVPMRSGNEGIQVAATSYCYAGTTVDPTTGETVDLYNLCVDDLDMA